jgi:S-phase kinase-associated protein 1
MYTFRAPQQYAISYHLTHTTHLLIVVNLRGQVSQEGTVYEVPWNVASMSGLVRETVSGDVDDSDNTDPIIPEVPLPEVSADVLEKVIEYCRYYQENDRMIPIERPLRSCIIEELVQEWYANFVKIDNKQVQALLSAAHFMDIEPLLQLTCAAMAILLSGKSDSEIREMFQ